MRLSGVTLKAGESSFLPSTETRPQSYQPLGLAARAHAGARQALGDTFAREFFRRIVFLVHNRTI